MTKSNAKLQEESLQGPPTNSSGTVPIEVRISPEDLKVFQKLPKRSIEQLTPKTYVGKRGEKRGHRFPKAIVTNGLRRGGYESIVVTDLAAEEAGSSEFDVDKAQRRNQGARGASTPRKGKTHKPEVTKASGDEASVTSMKMEDEISQTEASTSDPAKELDLIAEILDEFEQPDFDFVSAAKSAIRFFRQDLPKDEK